MSFNERFGDIRHRLGDRPTPLTFARICKALLEMWEEAPEQVNEEIVPYVAEATATWPDDILVYPGFLDAHWLEPADHALGPLALMRKLDLSYRYLGPGLVDALAAQPHMTGLHVLDLRANKLDAPSLLTLRDLEHLAGVRTLRLGGNAVGAHDDEAELLVAHFGEAVEFG